MRPAKSFPPVSKALFGYCYRCTQLHSCITSTSCAPVYIIAAVRSMPIDLISECCYKYEMTEKYFVFMRLILPNGRTTLLTDEFRLHSLCRRARLFAVTYAVLLHLLIFYVIARWGHGPSHHISGSELQLLCSKSVSIWKNKHSLEDCISGSLSFSCLETLETQSMIDGPAPRQSSSHQRVMRETVLLKLKGFPKSHAFRSEQVDGLLSLIVCTLTYNM